ncbi:MAG TPA: hypothetical protein PLB01_12060 [Thermoanaerobaculia bacterium]|nr:hypothetical protein [Thermoanaerobaculia bacterium]
MKPAPRIVGPVAPAVYTKEGKSGLYKAVADVDEPLVTEGMKARQRQLDKKRRAIAMLRQVEVEEAEDRWRHYRHWIYRLVAVLAALGVYAKIQMTYGDKWPVWTVWIFLGTVILTALFWLFWYIDYSD